MNCEKIGNLIYKLRREKGMTQKQLADVLHVSDRAVSKWERGLGCPDVSLLRALSGILGVEIDKLLLGELERSERDGGNMKRVKFYICPECGNVLTATGTPEIACCGRRLTALEAKPADAGHTVSVSELEDEYYLTFSHEMSKPHYIVFAAYATWDRLLLVRLYPEQEGALRIPQLRGGRLYYACSRDGLFYTEL